MRIWEKIEKKQEEMWRKGEAEEEKRSMTDLRRNFQDVISDQTMKLRADMTRGRKNEEGEFGELVTNIKSMMAQMKKQEAEIESIYFLKNNLLVKFQILDRIQYQFIFQIKSKIKHRQFSNLPTFLFLRRFLLLKSLQLRIST